MSDPRIDSLTPDFGDFTPTLPGEERITSAPAEISAPDDAPEAAPTAEAARESESIADRSRRLVTDAFGEVLRQYQNAAVPEPSSQPQEQESPAAISVSPETEEPGEFLRAILELQREGRPEHPISEPDIDPEPEAEPDIDCDPVLKPAQEPEAKKRPRVTVGEDGIITIQYDPQPEETEEPEEAPSAGASPEESVPTDDTPEAINTPPDRSGEDAADKDAPTWKDRLLKPVGYVLAIVAAIRAGRAMDARMDDLPAEDEEPELSPKKAAKYYSAHARPLRTRTRIATLLCLILAWISFSFPMAGLLGKSVSAQAGVSLVLTLAVMLTTLDVLTAGIRQLCDLRPGPESLAALSALLACVDSVLVMTGHGEHLSYCAPAALSLTAALWGQRLNCTALRRTFSTAAGAKNPTVLTSELTSGQGGSILLRAPIGQHSIVRRSEQPDAVRSVYTASAPILIVLCLLLSVFASLGGNGSYFLHTFSGLIAVSAALSAFFAFPLPYALAARRLRDSGAAILGWAGCAELGQKRRILITDDDIFPTGTINFTAINIQEGSFIDKVVSYTASLLAASGSGTAEKFIELVTRRGYSMVDVGNYTCHEGGGLSACIRDEQILVGSANYMTLMGIHLPHNMESRNSICTAINGELVAVFTMEYTPVTSVQDALVTLLRGRIQGIFAIRDFNITPLMLRQLFRIPTENLTFPSFRERYRMASVAAGKTGPASAVITRSGMMPLVETAETGRRLYNAGRIGAAVSLAGSILGVIILFLLFRTGAYDTASAGNVLSYMLLWALPVVILSLGQNR